jgi:hypothetical protein
LLRRNFNGERLGSVIFRPFGAYDQLHWLIEIELPPQGGRNLFGRLSGNYICRSRAIEISRDPTQGPDLLPAPVDTSGRFFL